MTVPVLAELLLRVEQIPSAFLATPAMDQESGIPVDVVVCDLFETLFADKPGSALLAACRPSQAQPEGVRHARWILVASHLLFAPELPRQELTRDAIERFFTDELRELAALDDVSVLHQDEERREELVRRALRAGGLRLPGESEAEADDRLRQVDRVARAKLLAEAEERERRAREVREAMRRRAAEEAAAKMCRE